jgi:ABC-type bacteriocin/lantibiotic exporter with double-glycine peptidase domain
VELNSNKLLLLLLLLIIIIIIIIIAAAPTTTTTTTPKFQRGDFDIIFLVAQMEFGKRELKHKFSREFQF